uniref:Odorant receptor n=1 Tax=Manduca sexta TaxID=7130 RepID=A0A0P1J1L8_MANSE|nr:Olfactory receptor 11 [Manduca sexta]
MPRRYRNDNKKEIMNNVVLVLTNFMRKMGRQNGYQSGNVHWLAKFAILCYLSTYILQLIAVFLAKGDTERLFECVSVACFCGVGLLKLYLLLSKHSRWSFLINQITLLENKQLNSEEDTFCLDYKSEDEDSENQFTPYIISYNKRFVAISTILVRIYVSTGVVYAVSPFAEYSFRKVFLNETLGYPHILPCWAVLDELSFLGYLLTIVAEAVAAIYCVVVHITFDITAVGIMIFICGQFESLRRCSESIGGKGKVCNVTAERDARARFRIKKCHRIHVILIHSIKELKELIKNILGVYFFVATFKLCSLAVRLKTENMSKMQLVTLVQYLGASITQLFLLCYYGDAVFNESAITMGQGPFGAAIWCVSPKIRRDIVILGMGMMKPHSLQAGPFNVLNLPSFIQIVRTAYSCYAVIGPK